MPSSKTVSAGKRRFLTTASAVVLLGCAIVGYGLMTRGQSEQAVATWTDKQSMPTVAIADKISVKPTQPLSLPGNIQPLNKAAIFARVNGYVRSWDHDIGTSVKAGQVLATIDAPDLDQQLSQAKANLASVKASLQIATLTANRNNVLVEKQVVAQQMADQTNADANAKAAVVEANEANVRQLEATQSFKTLSAPFDGVITARNVELGMLINSGGTGQPLFEVSDLHRVRIYVQVPQAFSASLKPGVSASFDLPQYPGQQFHAQLTHISRSFTASSRTMQVELQADNADGTLFGGSYCTVHFDVPVPPSLVQVPATALMATNKGTNVATVDGDGKVAIRQVKLGRDFGDSVEILSGLTASDQVIDSPPETIVDGEQVQIAQKQNQSAGMHSADASTSGDRAK